MRTAIRLLAIGLVLVTATHPLRAGDPDLIVRGGKILTVDPRFSIAEAMAIEGEKIAAVGLERDIMKLKGANTRVLDLEGKTVIPGIIDSHTHPNLAAMTEFAGEIPTFESVEDVLAHLKARARDAKPGEWIVLRQVFITRLAERRYPTRTELDLAAPANPVVFATGPDASVNSLALSASGIDRDYQLEGAGKIERDPTTGEPTGILRNCERCLKIVDSGPKPTEAQKDERLLALLHAYTAVGITGVIDRNASAEDVERYRRLGAAGKPPLRIAISHQLDPLGPIDRVTAEIRRIASDPLAKPNDRLRVIGVKTFLDGGMLTGSAYMLKPWGVSKIYAITDPEYRGVLFIPKDRLAQVVRTTVESGLQFTAHSVGDGAVTALLDAYEEVNASVPIAATRPAITHSNFMTESAVKKAGKLGVVIDFQPAWLYLDAATLKAHFGAERLRWFQPLKSLLRAGVVIGGGSDHMQKVGSLRSINPYNPFLGMWTAITRRGKRLEGRLFPEEALSREEALRFYTINNAALMFLETKIGSLETGKLADFAVLDRDILSCPEDDLKETKVVETYVSGKRVHRAKNAAGGE